MDLHLIPGAVATPEERGAIAPCECARTWHQHPARAHPPSGTCCCPRSTPRRRASAGSAKARSITSASGCPCRRPRRTASRSFYTMFSLKPRPPHGGPRLRRHRVPRRRRGDLPRSRVTDRQGRRSRRRRPSDVVAQPVPRPVRAGAGRPLSARRSGARGQHVDRRHGRRCRRGAAGRVRLQLRRGAARTRQERRALCTTRAITSSGATSAAPPRRRRESGESRRLSRAWRLRGAAGARSRSAQRASSARCNDSRLVGRGGALFPTGRKWDAVARAAVRPHYMVCNADESEPGTFKDRVLMEEDPFARSRR